jgi:hypothetical protein
VHIIIIEPYSYNAQAEAPSTTNQTSLQSTNQPEISILEKKIVPAQETTVIVIKKFICQSTDPSTSTGTPK